MAFVTLMMAAVMAAETAPAAPASPVISACLFANLTRENSPKNLYGMVRRFPTGELTRDLAWLPEATNPPADPLAHGPRVRLVYGIEKRAAGPLKQLAVSDAVVFDDRSPSGPVSFAFYMEGLLLERVPWPEYSAAVARYKATGQPRYVGTEIWAVWGQRGLVLREILNMASNPLEVRLEDKNGRTFRSAIYELAKSPLDDAAAVADLIDDSSDKECPFKP